MDKKYFFLNPVNSSENIYEMSEEEFAKIASYECCHKWWKQMCNYLVTATPDAVKAKEEPMEMVFHLD